MCRIRKGAGRRRDNSLWATGTPPPPPLGILCHHDFLNHQGHNYHQKKVCTKVEAQEHCMAYFV